MKNAKIQWHPAFDAALQIELAEDADCLVFEPEHLLSKKPMQMDMPVFISPILKRLPQFPRQTLPSPLYVITIPGKC